MIIFKIQAYILMITGTFLILGSFLIGLTEKDLELSLKMFACGCGMTLFSFYWNKKLKSK